MATPNRKVALIIISAVAVFIVIGFAWTVGDIELRLWRNGKVAQALAQSLEVRFPGGGFRGAASYKDERVYIVVANRFDQTVRDDVETWLRKEKGEHKIAPQIRLRFAGDDLGKDVIID
jgi:hypothetical protein